MLAANVDAEDGFERVVIVEAICQRLEHRPSLMDGKTDSQHPLSRFAEELPSDHAGIAGAPA